MKDKTIVLWGKGNIGKDTYKKYFMNQNVIMVDSSVIDVEYTNILGNEIAVFNPTILRANKHKYNVFVCMKKHREDVYKLLDINGYKKNVNYFSYRFLDKDIIDPEECLFGGKEIIVKEKKSGKKVVAFFGTCHMGVYKDSLKQMKSFTEKYIIIDLPLVNEVDLQEHKLIGEKWLWEECDCVFLNQIFAINQYKVPDTITIMKWAKNAQSFVISNAMFKGYFPQTNTRVKTSMLDYFTWGDININYMLKKGMGCEDIVSNICDVNFYKKEEVDSYFLKELRSLEKLEKNCDIQVTDIIAKNYKEYLYRSWSHPTKIMFKKIIDKICKMLDLREKYEIKFDLIYHEQIVYPSIIEKLDLDKNFYIGRKINPGNYDVQYDIEQYIKEYVKRRK